MNWLLQLFQLINLLYCWLLSPGFLWPANDISRVYESFWLRGLTPRPKLMMGSSASDSWFLHKWQCPGRSNIGKEHWPTNETWWRTAEIYLEIADQIPFIWPAKMIFVDEFVVFYQFLSHTLISFFIQKVVLIVCHWELVPLSQRLGIKSQTCKKFRSH